MRARFVASMFFVVLAVLISRLSANTAERYLQIAANRMVELSFRADRTHTDPFNDLTLDVVVTDPRGHELRVPGFWAGAEVWKARYSSPILGSHRFRTECSDVTDTGLQGVRGT